jgi:uncharacterized RDD family membrane protein YckC
MKCPKCQYISFDSGDRCRNCGYEFLLHDAAEADRRSAADLRLQNGHEAEGPLADFFLNDTPNLPLFKPERDLDAPLVAPRAAPRAPLAVRRTSPAQARQAPARSPQPRVRVRREEPRPEPLLALDSTELSPADDFHTERETLVQAEPVAPPAADSGPSSASTPARLAGGVVDLLLIAAIDATTIYLTLRICDLTFRDVGALPIAPLVSFLALLNGGYLATFVAASGQTIGKMAAGTRVVPSGAGTSYDRVSLGHAVVRAAAYLVSALPAGLGFLPALVGRDGRALHDRLADTRVVKA